MDIIIPFSITLEDGACTVSCYPSVRSVVENFLVRYENDLFSETALHWLQDKLSPLVSFWGYSENREAGTLCIYRLDSASQIRHEKIRSDSVFTDTVEDIENEDFYDDLSGFLTGLPEEGLLTCVTLQGHRILSAAGENSPMEQDASHTITEIGVATGEFCRGLGYGVSNVAALSSRLFNEGRQRIYYKCSSLNLPSRKTAESAGFRLVGQEYHYVCYAGSLNDSEGDSGSI